MGFFGEYLLHDGTWIDWEGRRESVASLGEPWLSLTINDSDLAILTYAPRGPGSGVAYVGATPRVLFDDHSEPASPDVATEALGLATWVASVSRSPSPDISSLRDLIATFLASDDDPGESVNEDADEADVFAEIKVRRLLDAVALPIPADLPGQSPLPNHEL